MSVFKSIQIKASSVYHQVGLSLKKSTLVPVPTKLEQDNTSIMFDIENNCQCLNTEESNEYVLLVVSLSRTFAPHGIKKNRWNSNFPKKMERIEGRG